MLRTIVRRMFAMICSGGGWRRLMLPERHLFTMLQGSCVVGLKSVPVSFTRGKGNCLSNRNSGISRRHARGPHRTQRNLTTLDPTVRASVVRHDAKRTGTQCLPVLTIRMQCEPRSYVELRSRTEIGATAILY